MSVIGIFQQLTFRTETTNTPKTSLANFFTSANLHFSHSGKLVAVSRRAPAIQHEGPNDTAWFTEPRIESPESLRIGLSKVSFESTRD